MKFGFFLQDKRHIYTPTQMIKKLKLKVNILANNKSVGWDEKEKEQ